MKDNWFLFVVLGVMVAPVYAQENSEFECTLGELTRRVLIMHEPGVSVPCEVHYYKDTEAPGERQVLWRALNEAGYCEAKTSEFVTMLSGMGWNCAAISGPQPAVEEEPDAGDDTDALAPVE